MGRDDGSTSIWTDSTWRWGIWLVLLVAFSPVLLDLVGHLKSNPWSRTVLIFPWLAWVAARSDRGALRDPTTTVIWGALVFALAFELVAISGDVLRIARVGMGVGLVGLIWGAGWARPVPALLLVWAIPLPNVLLDLSSPGLERLLGSLCGRWVPGIDFEVVQRASVLSRGDGASLVLRATDGGLALLIGLAGIGWFRSAVEGAGMLAATGGALRWSMLGIPVHVATVLGAGGLLVVGETGDSARWMMDHAEWAIVLILGFGFSLAPLRRGLENPVEGV